MADNSQLAITYAALILHDDEVPITADKLNSIVKAAGVSVEPFWATVFADLLQNINVGDLLTNVGAGGGAPAAGGAAAGGAGGAEAEAEKSESEAEESDDDMGFSLFD